MLAALTLLAGLVRWVGLDHGLPHAIEPDSECAQQLEVFRGERRPGPAASALATYPHLVARVAQATSSPPAAPDQARPRDLEGHLRAAADTYLDTRRAAALLSLLVVPATFLIARRFATPGCALLAAALAGFSLLGVGFAQQARPHAPAAALVTLAVAASMRLAVRGDLCSWLAASAAAALAVATLQSGVAVLGALAAAHLFGARRRLLEPRALVLPACLALALVGAYPFLLEGQPDGPVDAQAARAIEGPEEPGRLGHLELRRQGDTLWIAEHNLELDRFDGGGFARVARTLWRYEPALLLLLLPALWALVRRRSGGAGPPEAARAPRAPSRPSPPSPSGGELAAVLGYALPYALVLGLYGETFERFVLPLVPLLATLAAWGLSRLRSRRLALGLGTLALGFTVLTSARLAWLHTRPDTFELAAAWVADHVPATEPVFLSPIPNPVHGDSSMELPLLRTPEALEGPGGQRSSRYNLWSRYQARLPAGAVTAGTPRFELAWLTWSRRRAGVPARVDAMEFLSAHPGSFFSASGPGWFVVEDHRGRPENRTELLLQDALEELGQRHARFVPDRPGARAPSLPLGYQDRDEEGGRWPHPAWRVLTARASGPAIEVWRVDAAALEAVGLSR